MSEAAPPSDSATPATAVPGVVPVTVIGGYLGSGKTTLVNHILRTAEERIAVLVNDFGDVGIDADLIESTDGDTISLANGCVCCSLVDGLAAALVSIQEMQPRPERLVIEASGVADPGSVAAYAHGPGLTLDAVVVVVDVETVQERASDRYVGDTVLAQLSAAEIVVANKIDLVDDDRVEHVRTWLAQAAPAAVIVDAVDAAVARAVLFGRTTGEARRGHGPLDPARSARGGGAEETYQQWSWRSEKNLDRAAVEQLMADLPAGVVRAKGILWLTEAPDQPMVLQRVGRRWTLRPVRRPTSPTGSHLDGPSRLEVIGLHGVIDEPWLAARLQPASRPPG